MPKRTRFDAFAEKGRERVRKYRHFRKVKSIHERNVYEKINSIQNGASSNERQEIDLETQASSIDIAEKIKNKLAG